MLEEKNLRGEEKILDKTCKVYQGKLFADENQTKIWSWYGITLKEEKNEFGSFKTREAIKIEENVPLDAALFSIPPGMKVKRSK
ncbi:MAG: hypothetical protein HYZ85_00445 [Candidatus Omnitrophica bacterium]|nr:hypothetical protein [Candidatus Omnitrophota bacterium]